MKEDEDFVIVTDPVWQFLQSIYGGQDIPRISIEIDKDNDSSVEGHEYIIEIYLQKVNLYILPKVGHHLCLKKPSAIFISRKATIFDLRKRIAEILHDNKKDRSVKDFMNIARFWRLDTGENIFEIEKFYD
jgi:hypothetical protein